MATATQGQVQVKALQGDNYGYPNHTNWLEQPDNNSGITTTLGTTTVPVTGIVSFRQVDTVRFWRMRQFISNVVVTAGGTLNSVSQYAPYNFTGNIFLGINNLYNVVDLPNGGEDLAIFNTIRPVRGNVMSPGRYQNPINWPYAVSENNLAIRPAAANTSNSPPAALTTPTSATSYVVEYDIPTTIYLDHYFDLDPVTGEPIAEAEDVEVTPLNMGLNGRDATPQITMNPVIGAVSDNTPFVETGTGAGFTSGQVLHDFRRIGTFNSKNVADMPPEYNWRYYLCSRKVAIGAQSSLTIPLKSVLNANGGGQIFSIFLRFFDPAAAATAGAAISVGSYSATAQSFVVTNAKLQYGSGYTRFDDDPASMQARFFDSHNVQLPSGVLCWDLLESINGKRTNKAALNLLTTDAQIVLTFNAALSSSSYVIVGTEGLCYVPPAVS